MRITKTRIWIALLGVGLAAPHGPALAAINEAVAFGIDDFSSATSCYEKDTLHHSVEFAEVFHESFQEWKRDGIWDSSHIYRDDAVDAMDWSDAAKVDLGADDADPRGADHADVALISTHGWHRLDSPGPRIALAMGDRDNNGNGKNCAVNSYEEMFLGQGDGNDLEIVILAACRTADYEVWQAGGMEYARDLEGNLNTWLGFHGVSYDSAKWRNHLEDFVQESLYEGLGDNWIDQMFGERSAWADQCPVALIWATDHEACDAVYDHGGWRDRNNDGEGQKFSECYYFVSGCDPKRGIRLPSCSGSDCRETIF